MIHRKTALLILLIALMSSLAPAFPGTSPQTVTAQEENKYFLPFFSNSREPLHSTSYYMITVDTEFTYNLGCELGTRDQQEPGAQDSVVVLDFGLPYYSVENGFGTYLFGFGPVGLSEIRIAAEHFAEGYYNCTGSDNDSNLVLGIGTNNKPNSLNTAEKMQSHGAVWARTVNNLNQTLLDRNMLQQVQAYGASDIELDWNSPTNTKAWLTGYGSLAEEAPLLYFGDAAGCPFDAVPGLTCGTANYPEWTMEDVWYVSWGFEPSLPLPLIYLTNGVHAQQWAHLSQYAYNTHGTRMDFTGVFTQWQACEQWHTCENTDNTPSEAYWQLYHELNKNPETAQELNWKTDIRWILEGEAYPESYRALSEGSGELPPSLTGLMEDLSVTLQSQVDAETETQITAKLAILENLAAKMQASGENPAPKGKAPITGSQALTDPEFIEGIIPDGEIAGLPYGAKINSVWQALTESGYLQIGAGSSPDHPGKGALYIQNISQDKTSVKSTLLVTEEMNGRLKIMEASPTRLLLQSESGIWYVLDLETFALSSVD